MTTSMLPDVGIELREGYAEVGDVNLHYVEAGDGPLIVLLHGFPECWFGWRLQIAPLARADQRNDLKAARTSVEKSSGSSHAAKWPPRSTSLK